VVLVLIILSLTLDERPSTVTVTVFIDNAQVVSRSNDRDYVKAKLSEYGVLDYDF